MSWPQFPHLYNGVEGWRIKMRQHRKPLSWCLPFNTHLLNKPLVIITWNACWVPGVCRVLTRTLWFGLYRFRWDAGRQGGCRVGSEALCWCSGIQLTEWVENKRGLFCKSLKVFNELWKKNLCWTCKWIIELTFYACRHQPLKAE